MLDRDANWGCVRGMINVTLRSAGSCVKKHHCPLVKARGNHKGGDKKETGEDQILGAKTG